MQLSRVAAEEARAAAAEKAREAEDEKARLAADRAKKAERDKAAAAAKAAEDARLAAEKAKQIEEARAVAAEQRRKEAEAAAAKAIAEKQAAEKIVSERIANEKAAAELAAKQAAERKAAEIKAKEEGEQKIAAIAPTSPQPSLSPQETAKLVQLELRRVGCLKGTSDGEWNAQSQRSLTLFNKHAGTTFEPKLASLDALDAIKSKQGRVCPLICDRGYKASGDACEKITCRSGYRVNDDNECEKLQEKKPVAARDDQRSRDAERKQIEQSPSKPQASGQIICGQTGCRPVQKGCRLERASAASGSGSVGSAYAGNGMGGLVEICR